MLKKKISGGKDSCFNMMHCIANGHEIVALANLKPSESSHKCIYFLYILFLSFYLYLFIYLIFFFFSFKKKTLLHSIRNF